MNCRDCNDSLTQEEIEFYESRCEACERLWLIRILAWQHGESDPELDDLFAGFPQPWRVTH